MRPAETNAHAAPHTAVPHAAAPHTGLPGDETLAIRALVWTLSDDARAARLLALTGLDAVALRARAGEPALLAATIAFLAAHEPDLVACADALGVPPAALAELGERLAA